ncbi:MAG: amidase [Acidimicrobiales bacterium]|nr:amidase [Acidimicrobiales bacterium]
MTPTPLLDRSLLDVAAAVRAGDVSPVDLLEAALARAARVDALNSLAHVDAEGALLAAEERADEAHQGRIRGPLHGVPVTVKDLFVVEGLPTGCGTRAPLPRLGRHEATAVGRLRDAGAVILGKTNLHEVALGITGENPWTGDVHNPHDRRRQAGGSSSGSAVAVATGVGWASLASDTAGSIRIPAALCGVVGFKPTLGAVPLDGALPLCATCDHAGPITRSVPDAATVFGVLAGRAVTPPVAADLRPPVVGAPLGPLQGTLSSGVRASYERLLEALAGAGADVHPVDGPSLGGAVATYLPLLRSEAAHVHRRAVETEPDSFSDPVRAVLREGLDVRAVDYLEALRQRRRLLDELVAAMEGVDVLVLPATPVPAPLRGAVEVELETGTTSHRTAFLRLTVLFSLVGVPTAVVPVDRVDGLPVGVQVVGRRGHDVAVLGHAAWIEAVAGQPAAPAEVEPG